MINNMKLIFNKNNNKGYVKIEMTDNKEEFDYVNMLKYLINGEELEKSEFSGEFSTDEKDAVDEMVRKINQAVNNEGDIEENTESVAEKENANPRDNTGDEMKIENIPF